MTQLNSSFEKKNKILVTKKMTDVCNGCDIKRNGDLFRVSGGVICHECLNAIGIAHKILRKDIVKACFKDNKFVLEVSMSYDEKNKRGFHFRDPEFVVSLPINHLGQI